MALDQQRNWTISMAENLDAVQRSGKHPPNRQNIEHDPPTTKESKSWNGPPIYLPDEVIIQVVESVSRSRQTLAACCLLSRQWYTTAVPFLYARPWITGKNFEPFVNAICPSINLHVRKSRLADLVTVLDMSHLVHSASRRTTARLLGRTKNHLEEFVAPQSGFGMNCFPALGKCRHLRALDLSLVSESPPLLDLFKTISHLESLVRLRLPRSAGFSTGLSAADMTWPPNLEDLCLSGGIDVHFLQGRVSFPQSLKSLTIEHCPAAKHSAIVLLLRTAVQPLPNLESLRLANLPRLTTRALDDVLMILPGLTKLSISVDYVTPALLDIGDRRFHPRLFEGSASPRHQWDPERQCLLQTLELTNSGNPPVDDDDQLTPIDIMIAIDEGTLPDLRQVRVAKSLMWHTGATAEEADSLVDALKNSASQRGEKVATETGVWTFDG